MTTPTGYLPTPFHYLPMPDKNFQCAGYCDIAHEEGDYSLTIASKELCISIEYMTKDDLLELKSCIDCMLEDIEIEEPA